MSRLRRLHISFGNSFRHNRNQVKFPIHTPILPSPGNRNDGTDEFLFLQPRGIFERPTIAKADTQAGVYGHSAFDLPGRRILLSPWLLMPVWSLIFIFIGMTIAGFFLAYQARREFRTRVEEQRKLLQNQASGDQSKPPMSTKELKSFTRKSIMVLNSSSQKPTSSYRVSVAGHLVPRNVFERPSRDSILVAQISPQSEGCSHEDSYSEFARRAARESFWDTTPRQSIVSVASVSSMMSKLQKRKVIGFAMMEQLDDQALDDAERPKRQHRPQHSPPKVKDHTSPHRYAPTTPSRMSQSITFADSIEPATPTSRRVPPSATTDSMNGSRRSPASEQASPAPISADEALAQYASSRSITPALTSAQPSRSNSFLRLVRRSLTAPSLPSVGTPTSDPLIPKSHAELPTMQPMSFLNGDFSGTMSDPVTKNPDSRLQPFSLAHSVIIEEEVESFNTRQLQNSAMLMNSVDIQAQPLNVTLPSRLPQAFSSESATPQPAFQSANIRPKLKISPTTYSCARDLADPTHSYSNSTSPVSSLQVRTLRGGLSSPGSTATYTSFSSFMQHSTPPSSVSSSSESKSNKEHDLHNPQSKPPPSLSLTRLPSVYTTPPARRKRQNDLPSSPRDEMSMVRLKNRQENLKRNLSNPTQSHNLENNLAVGHTPPKAAAIRRTASAQARIPLGGTMSSGGVRDSSFLP